MAAKTNSCMDDASLAVAFQALIFLYFKEKSAKAVELRRIVAVVDDFDAKKINKKEVLPVYNI